MIRWIRSWPMLWLVLILLSASVYPITSRATYANTTEPILGVQMVFHLYGGMVQVDFAPGQRYPPTVSPTDARPIQWRTRFIQNYGFYSVGVPAWMLMAGFAIALLVSSWRLWQRGARGRLGHEDAAGGGRVGALTGLPPVGRAGAAD